jgi:hypothetical protein
MRCVIAPPFFIPKSANFIPEHFGTIGIQVTHPEDLIMIKIGNATRLFKNLGIFMLRRERFE